MRIDAHQHFWPYEADQFGWIDESTMGAIAKDFMPPDLAPLMDAVGMDASIAVQARENDADTDWLLDLADDPANRIAGVVGWIDYFSDALGKRLAALADREKLVGFRYVVQAQPDPRFMLGEDFIAGVRQSLAAGYAYDLLINYEQVPHAPAFLEACGEGRIVIDHLAKPAIGNAAEFEGWASAMRACGERPGTFCKLSGLVTEADWASWQAADFNPYLDVVMEAFGPDRVMFGSDWPVCLLAGSYATIYRIIEDYVTANCPGKEAAIFGGNAMRAYQL